jgi:hypothetical protein
MTVITRDRNHHAVAAQRDRADHARHAFEPRRSTAAAGRTSRSKEGYWSFWIFLIHTFLFLVRELIAAVVPDQIRRPSVLALRQLFQKPPSAATRKPRSTILSAKLIADKGTPSSGR